MTEEPNIVIPLVKIDGKWLKVIGEEKMPYLKDSMMWWTREMIGARLVPLIPVEEQ